ncbi:MAG: prepilin peptidase, partial [Janthinobacterium lividum]
RVWSQGLHQMIETKEGCALTHGQSTVAQMTFQRFFRRYIWLAGISGTLSDARHELAAIYGLRVQSVGLQFASQRKLLPSRIFAGQAGQWAYVAGTVQRLQREGRPVLVATEGVMDSQALSAMFAQAGIDHDVLNAATNASEQHIVERAGGRGAVTISTNIAGRGTDIRLAQQSQHLGGLHVIACQSNDSRRIDRQLYGRSARQGQPGSAEHLYRLDQPHCRLSRLALKLARRMLPSMHATSEMPRVFLLVARLAQSRRSRMLQKQRWNLLLHSLQAESHLAFSGQHE